MRDVDIQAGKLVPAADLRSARRQCDALRAENAKLKEEVQFLRLPASPNTAAKAKRPKRAE